MEQTERRDERESHLTRATGRKKGFCSIICFSHFAFSVPFLFPFIAYVRPALSSSSLLPFSLFLLLLSYLPKT